MRTLQIAINEEEIESLTNSIAEKIAEKIFNRLKDLTSQNGKEYLTPKELSSYLKIKKSSIYQLVHQRSVPFCKINRRLRFDKKKIDQWIKNKE